MYSQDQGSSTYVDALTRAVASHECIYRICLELCYLGYTAP